MESKSRFYIYGRKEMLVLTFLATLVAAFAFTLGLHLGKKIALEVTVKTEASAEHGAEHGEAEGKIVGVKASPDEVPERHELADYVKKSDEISDNYLDKRLHEEVTKTGLKVDIQRQTELPEETKSPSGGATTIRLPKTAPDAKKSESSANQGKERVGIVEPPIGHFTLQVGSYKAREDARNRVELLESVGKKAFIRTGLVNGQQWFRVYLGGFQTRKEAEVSGARFKSDRVIDSFVVSKMP